MYPKTQNKIYVGWKNQTFSGAVYCFIAQGKEEIKVLGDASFVPQKEKMTQKHLFDVASLTKVVCTTTVVLRLLEEQVVFLDDPLQKYLPQFQDKRVTLRHLLTHTADLNSWISHRDQLSKEELKQAYLSIQAGDKLGRQVQYTDTGMILLSFMLEELFQESATSIFQKEVLTPLQMKDSSFSPKKDKKIVPTEQLTSGKILKGETHDPKARVLKEHAGNAGLFTTIGDLIRFVRVYLQETNFLDKGTIRSLLQDQTLLKNGNRSLGWDLKDTNKVLFHTGYTGAFLAVDPIAQQAFIFLSNRIHPRDYKMSYIRYRDELIDCYLKEKNTLNML
ncbi:serine hydrolase [Tetragenococcus osmophilus]|uniref:Serine hydrolase n=1 Tax=Tetragenococcus osmophilus TaxID=526944 RepID=A0AA38CXN9_9ENTE|nr:serine hydrolase domain-containing protein [Tetragenococcus osmophilus]AYW47571.1 serine hydrolase [Tetragenococcus osmophilus]GMA53190.1 serine hydrolase [Alicyclobacillus contaminans]GMA72836.1 serine hydrolase [Tetragenococcus osmophilus]